MSLDRLPDSAVRKVDSGMRKAKRSFCERLSEGMLKPLDPVQASIAEAEPFIFVVCVHVVSPEFLSE